MCETQPNRDLLIGLTFLAACLAYTDRVNISVAALAMQQQFGWSQTQKGFVLSSFFIGYMLCMRPLANARNGVRLPASDSLIHFRGGNTATRRCFKSSDHSSTGLPCGV